MSPPLAPPGWSRWLVPPAALSVHLSIGQAYAWSVFKPPLESALGLTGTQSALPFQLGIVMLGLSAAFGGTLVERNGPRWAMTVALICFSSGFLLVRARRRDRAVLADRLRLRLRRRHRPRHRLHLAGLDPDQVVPRPARHGHRHRHHGLRRRRAHRLALVGADAGVVRQRQLRASRSRSSCTGSSYAVFMTLGVLLVRVPRAEKPGAERGPSALDRAAGLRAQRAVRTPQFWCLWVVLCMNVTAGIGILEKAAPMITDFFADTSHPGLGLRRGRLRRAALGGQHGGPHRLVLDLRPDRPQEHLPRLPGRRAR